MKARTAEPKGQETHGNILLVDDDATVRHAYARALRTRGWTVEESSDGIDAIGKIAPSAFDVVISDIAMPGMGGLEFLRAVRGSDLDVPVVLMTGAPELDSAIRAIEYGAFHYLTKPVDMATLEGVVRRAARLHTLARLKREAFSHTGASTMAMGDRAGLEARFGSALDKIWMAFQPIVSWRERRVYGYEALLRSDEPTLRSPLDVFAAAERLDRVHDVGHVVRARVAADAVGLPADAKLFVNLHAADLADEELYAPESPLTKIAERVVLEITERASLDGIKNVAERVVRLRDLGFEIAIDDLGAGYAGLTSFALLDPHVAKLDMSIVRDVDTNTRKRSVIRSISALCVELGVRVICEGVETAAERDVLAEAGTDLFQGYLFAKPERGFMSPRW
jgi:EAL domain-containing protein (putative c-di-GMP-specific phosphodiesterase class I)